MRETGDSLLSNTSCGVWEEIAKRDQHGPVWTGKGPGGRWDAGQDPASQRIDRQSLGNGRRGPGLCKAVRKDTLRQEDVVA